MKELQKCLQLLGMWKGTMPITYFLRNSGILKVYNLSDFQSSNLFKKTIPRSGKAQYQYSDLFDYNTKLLFKEYNEVHQRDMYGQEKLGLLPIMIIDCLRNGKVDLAIEYSEENLKLHGGLSSLQKNLERPINEKFRCPAILPAVNFLSLKFMSLRESPDVSWNKTTEELVTNYRMCVKAVGKSEEMADVQEMIGDNFSEVTKMAAKCDDRLLAENTVTAPSFIKILRR